MSAPVLVYLAHPVSAPDAAGVEANLRQFRRWLRYFVDLPDDRCRRISWCAPWLAYVEAIGADGEYRARGMRDALVAVDHCEAIVVLAKRTSGVRDEIDRSAERTLPLVDLTGMGWLPPVMSVSNWWAQADTRGVIAQLGGMVDQVDQRRARGAA